MFCTFYLFCKLHLNSCFRYSYHTVKEQCPHNGESYSASGFSKLAYHTNTQTKAFTDKYMARCVRLCVNCTRKTIIINFELFLLVLMRVN